MNTEKPSVLKNHDKEAYRLVILFVILMSVLAMITYLQEHGIIILKW